MSFTVTRKYGGTRYGDDIEARDASVTYDVISSTANPDSQDVLAAQGLPQRGQSYPGDYWLQVKRRPFRQRTDYLFEVVCDYEMPDASDRPTSEDGDPLNQPTQITSATVLYQEEMDEDAFGRPLRTANGEPYDPGITADHDDVAITVTKNFRTFSYAAMVRYQNKCNLTEWMGFEPYVCRVTGIASDEVRGQGNVVQYYRVSVTVQIRDRDDPKGNKVGWKRRVIHQGFQIWNLGLVDDEGDPIIIHAVDDSTPPQRVTEPVLLAENGMQLEPGEDPIFNLYRPYKEADFNTMNLF